MALFLSKVWRDLRDKRSVKQGITDSTFGRTLVHYGVAGCLFALYGVQVCPFTEQLTPLQLSTQVIVLFTFMLPIRFWLTEWVAKRPAQVRLGANFRSDFLLFVIAGSLYGVWNLLFNGFPVESGLKILLGMVALGFFVGIELSLAYQLDYARRLAAEGRHMELGENSWSLTAKFRLFSTAHIVLVLGVVALVIAKDLDWMFGVGTILSLREAQNIVSFEIAFVGVVLLAYTLRIITLYARNQHFVIANEEHVLQQVTNGRRDLRVPITSNDEMGRIASHTNRMVAELERREAEVTQTRDVAILGLASLAETRDNETGAHILRTQRYVRTLARYLQQHSPYADQLDDETVQLLFKSAPLHDIGKVGIPDAILLKPGKLTEEEFTIMKTHARIGSDALARAESELGSNSFLRLAREIAVSHHEKWDGSGYPNGLSGEEIPLSGRLMAVADVYDALISRRVYKPAFSHEKSVEMILEGKGKHFDPVVIDAFVACCEQFADIAKTYSDEATKEEERETLARTSLTA